MITTLEPTNNFTSEEYEALLRRDLVTFIERSFLELNPETIFIPSPHIEVLATKLEQCRRGELRRLIINLPPRSLKSHTASVAFVAWLFGHNPAAQVICASYGQELADKHEVITSAQLINGRINDCEARRENRSQKEKLNCMQPEHRILTLGTSARHYRNASSICQIICGTSWLSATVLSEFWSCITQIGHPAAARFAGHAGTHRGRCLWAPACSRPNT
jgi:hypothetical protein